MHSAWCVPFQGDLTCRPGLQCLWWITRPGVCIGSCTLWVHCCSCIWCNIYRPLGFSWNWLPLRVSPLLQRPVTAPPALFGGSFYLQLDTRSNENSVLRGVTISAQKRCSIKILALTNWLQSCVSQPSLLVTPQYKAMFSCHPLSLGLIIHIWSFRLIDLSLSLHYLGHFCWPRYCWGVNAILLTESQFYLVLFCCVILCIIYSFRIF